MINVNFAQTSNAEPDVLIEAKKVAEQTEDIQVWECKKSGNVTFVQSVADTDGSSKFVQVFYDEDSKSFAQANKVTKCTAPKDGATCSPKDPNCAPKAASCCSKGKSTESQASSTAKSCSKTSSSSSCCASKNKTDQAQTSTTTKSCSKTASNSSCCASKKDSKPKAQ